MTSAQQNVLESKIDRQRMDLRFEAVWSKEGQDDGTAGAARREGRRSQLGELMFQTVLVNSQTSDFRFKRLSRNPEFGSRA